ncbi:MAG: dihydrodipicolinate reductase [Rhodobacteraceae bacterium]|nr:dihydrodipicolinate reductase [Paracoccaceae bacterium]
MQPIITVALLAGLSLASPVWAEEFEKIDDRSEFVELVDGKSLARFGITLDVRPDGRIVGRAFGTDVSGAWRWDGGYFCRDLFWGKQDLGPNCQEVRLNGDTLRFISDQGTGQFADLRLE